MEVYDELTLIFPRRKLGGDLVMLLRESHITGCEARRSSYETDLGLIHRNGEPILLLLRRGNKKAFYSVTAGHRRDCSISHDDTSRGRTKGLQMRGRRLRIVFRSLLIDAFGKTLIPPARMKSLVGKKSSLI